MDDLLNMDQAIDEIIAELTVTIARVPPDPVPSGTMAGANVPGRAMQAGAMAGTLTGPRGAANSGRQADRGSMLGPIFRYYRVTVRPRIRALYDAFRPQKRQR